MRAEHAFRTLIKAVEGMLADSIPPVHGALDLYCGCVNAHSAFDLTTAVSGAYIEKKVCSYPLTRARRT